MSFSAKYHGLCPACSGPIVPGQKVEFVDDELQHVTCARPMTVCPVCHLTRPCEHDET